MMSWSRIEDFKQILHCPITRKHKSSNHKMCALKAPRTKVNMLTVGLGLFSAYIVKWGALRTWQCRCLGCPSDTEHQRE